MEQVQDNGCDDVRFKKPLSQQDYQISEQGRWTPTEKTRRCRAPAVANVCDCPFGVDIPAVFPAV